MIVGLGDLLSTSELRRNMDKTQETKSQSDEGNTAKLKEEDELRR